MQLWVQESRGRGLTGKIDDSEGGRKGVEMSGDARKEHGGQECPGANWKENA